MVSYNATMHVILKATQSCSFAVQVDMDRSCEWRYNDCTTRATIFLKENDMTNNSSTAFRLVIPQRILSLLGD